MGRERWMTGGQEEVDDRWPGRGRWRVARDWWMTGGHGEVDDTVMKR